MKVKYISIAKVIGSRMANEYINHGDYKPKEPWGCEGQIYPSLTGIALLNLYKVTQEDIYLKGARSIVESNYRKQNKSGGWPLFLGANGNGVRFTVSDDITNLTSKQEDLPSTATALRLASEYNLVTGDSSYANSTSKGFSYLESHWNEKNGTFDEMLLTDALRMRANPRDYHIYAFQCVRSFVRINANASRYLSPMYKSLKSSFEGMNADTYPLLYGMHAALISSCEQTREYLETIIKKKLIDEIAFNSKFKVSSIPGAFGHRDGLRGFCMTEGHLRNSIGVALALEFYDKATGCREFTSTRLYFDLESWILSMFNGRNFLECQDLISNEKFGDGSAAYFLPLFWILEEF